MGSIEGGQSHGHLFEFDQRRATTTLLHRQQCAQLCRIAVGQFLSLTDAHRLEQHADLFEFGSGEPARPRTRRYLEIRQRGGQHSVDRFLRDAEVGIGNEVAHREVIDRIARARRRIWIALFDRRNRAAPCGGRPDCCNHDHRYQQRPPPHAASRRSRCVGRDVRHRRLRGPNRSLEPAGLRIVVEFVCICAAEALDHLGANAPVIGGGQFAGRVRFRDSAQALAVRTQPQQSHGTSRTKRIPVDGSPAADVECVARTSHAAIGSA